MADTIKLTFPPLKSKSLAFKYLSMRDTSEGMIELINALKSDEGYFLIISVPKKSERKNFRFEVTFSDYRALRRILTSRLLETMPGVKYRYFWDGSMGGKTENKILLGIRCEVEQIGKRIDFEKLETFDEAEYLNIEA
jgi:hypothetical protein